MVLKIQQQRRNSDVSHPSRTFARTLARLTTMNAQILAAVRP